MEEKTLKINNLEINCKSLIEFSSLINVLLELAKKQKEKEKNQDNKNSNEQSQNFLNKKRIKYKVILYI